MENLMSINELAKELKKPPSTINTWRRRGDLPQELFFKIGGTVFVKKDKFLEWVESAA